MDLNKILQGDALSILKTLPGKIFQTTVTSPPYWGLRAYGTKPIVWPAVEYSILGFPVSIPEMMCELGHEPEPKAFIGHLILIFREVHRVMRDDGTLWLNMGDSYAAGPKTRSEEQAARKSNLKGGKSTQIACKNQMTKIVGKLKAKDLVGIPWMLAYALRDDGWYLRQDIIWNKPNPMPESVTDRCTKAHEYIFVLTKSQKYYFDQQAIRVPFKDESIVRLAQNIAGQKGSDRVPGKTNGKMKAVRKQYDKSQAGGGSRINNHNGYFAADGTLIGDGTANKKSVWTVTTKPFSEAHFATFPDDLIVDCIKAGSSEFGCCSECGSPFLRRVENEIKVHKNWYGDKHDPVKHSRGSAGRDYHEVVNRTTRDWVPSCKCKAAVDPCLILDPFMGAGTTAMVARKLLRNYIGIELNQEYINIATKRLARELGMFV